jgi:hypothetical protein
MPCAEDELETVFATAKKQAKDLYKLSAMGSESIEIKNRLAQDIKKSKEQIH